MWTIFPANKRGEKIKTEEARITKGHCCWTITGTKNGEPKEKHLDRQINPEEKIDFFVNELSVMECSY